MGVSLFPSLMRTGVPLAVGWVITALTSIGVDYGSEKVTAVVTVLFTGAYYTLFRVLERIAPTGGVAEKLFGALLGYARPPQYPPVDTLPPVSSVSRPADPYV